MQVRSLTTMCLEKVLLKTTGPTFHMGVAFMYSARLSPERITIMQTTGYKFILQFHTSCEIRPFSRTYADFEQLLEEIINYRVWRLKGIEFVNVAFYIQIVPLIEEAVEVLGVKGVELKNCNYFGIEKGDQAIRLHAALSRNNAAVVSEFGRDKLQKLMNAYRMRNVNPLAQLMPQPAAENQANHQ